MRTGSIIAIIFLTILSFTSCKKDPAPEISDNEKLEDKWTMLSRIVGYTSTSDSVGVPHIYNGQPEDYVEFRKNGRVYTFVEGRNDEEGDEFKLISKDKLIIAEDTLVIKELTDNFLTLYLKENHEDGYNEIIYTFKK